MAKPTIKKQQVLKFSRSTKGTHVYVANLPEGVDIPKTELVTQVYFQKGAIGDVPPATLTVTVETTS